MSLDAFIEAGLYDPGAPNADERREYLEYLLAQGFSVEDVLSVKLADAPVSDILAVLRGPRPSFYTAVEIAERTGLTPEEVEELRSMLGLPVKSLDSREISETFIDDVALHQFAVATYGKERTLSFVRVLGGVIASLMEAGRELTWSSSGDAPMTELEVAVANDASLAAWRVLPVMIGNLMMERAGRDISFEEELRRGSVSKAVAFVDLVGSTDWTARLTEQDHAAAMNRFEDLAVRLASRHGCRVVKFIGDEAMLVGSDVSQVTQLAWGLCEALAGDDVLPSARAAVGYGRVTPRGGDYFGEVVNLVARATKEAPAGGIVVTQAAAELLDASKWRLGKPRRVSLRGIAAEALLVDVALA